jgi:predicted secreted protein
MKKYLTLLLLSAVFLLAACAGKTGESPAVTDPDETIEVKAGQEFTITLETNPNTGLHWEVAVELDATILDVNNVRKVFVPDSAREDSPGKDVWTFTAIAPGETTITLGYYRGLTDVASRTLVFKIIVK